MTCLGFTILFHYRANFNFCRFLARAFFYTSLTNTINDRVLLREFKKSHILKLQNAEKLLNMTLKTPISERIFRRRLVEKFIGTFRPKDVPLISKVNKLKRLVRKGTSINIIFGIQTWSLNNRRV